LTRPRGVGPGQLPCLKRVRRIPQHTQLMGVLSRRDSFHPGAILGGHTENDRQSSLYLPKTGNDVQTPLAVKLQGSDQKNQIIRPAWVAGLAQHLKGLLDVSSLLDLIDRCSARGGFNSRPEAIGLSLPFKSRERLAQLPAQCPVLADHQNTPDGGSFKHLFHAFPNSRKSHDPALCGTTFQQQLRSFACLFLRRGRSSSRVDPSAPGTFSRHASPQLADAPRHNPTFFKSNCQTASRATWAVRHDPWPIATRLRSRDHACRRA